MQLSVRSYLTAGTAAVVGAGAIAIAPPLPASRHLELPLPAVAEVTLTGASFSISDIVGVLGGVLGGGGGASLPEIFGVPTDLLGVLGNLVGISLPGSAGTPAGDLLGAVVTEFIQQALPVVIEAARPLIDYVTGAVSGLIFGPNSIPAQVGAVLPTILPVVFDALGTGDAGAAFQALRDALAAPFNAINEVLAEAGRQVRVFIDEQLSPLLSALPGLVVSAVQSVIGIDVSGVLSVITNALGGLLGKPLSAASLPAGPQSRTAAAVEESAVRELAVQDAAVDAGNAGNDAADDNEPGAAKNTGAVEAQDQPTADTAAGGAQDGPDDELPAAVAPRPAAAPAEVGTDADDTAELAPEALPEAAPTTADDVDVDAPAALPDEAPDDVTAEVQPESAASGGDTEASETASEATPAGPRSKQAQRGRHAAERASTR